MKFLLLSYSRQQIFQHTIAKRFFSSPKHKKKKKKPKHVEFSAKARTVDPVRDELEKEFNLTKSIAHGRFFVLGKQYADKSALKILDRPSEPLLLSTPHILVDAGPGVLGRSLLKAGVTNLVLAEKDKQYLPKLKELELEFPNEVKIVSEMGPEKSPNCLSLNFSTITFKALFGHIKSSPSWNSAPPMRVIIPSLSSDWQNKRRNRPCDATNLRILLKYCAEVALQSGLFALGRTELCTFVSGFTYFKMSAPSITTSKRQFWPFTVVFAALFEVDVLLKIPNNEFSPIQQKRKISSVVPYDLENMYLIRIRPRKNIPNWLPMGNRENIYAHTAFLFFMDRLLGRSSEPNYLKKQTLCEIFGKWYQNGDKLIIDLGYTRLHSPIDLTVYDFIQIYQNFKNLPNIEESQFYHDLMVNYYEMNGYLKLQEDDSMLWLPIDEDDNIDFEVDDDDDDTT